MWLLFFSPLSRYPGPKLWAASRLPWAYHVIKGDLWPILNEFHDKYGPTVRIAPDEITFSQPEAWGAIYAAKPDLLKDPMSQTPPMNGADSLFTAIGETHKRIRGSLIHAFSEKALNEQVGIIEPYALQFIERLKWEAAKTPSDMVDIQKIFGYATFDIISDLAWGESQEALKCKEEQDWNQKFFLHAKFSTVRNCLSRYTPLDKILHYVFLRVTAKQREINNRMTWSRMDRRIGKGHYRSDFMTPVLDRIVELGNKGITKSEVLTNGVAVIVANSQLSTIALTTATYFLLTTPWAYRHAAEEVRSRFSDVDAITVTSTKALVYLQAVIQESLRVHHPTPGSLPRIAPESGVEIAGEFVPGGTVVGVSLLNIHTRPENFMLPNEFHPERFLPKDDPRYESRFQNDCLDAFKPFSTGPRNCIGSR